MDLVDELSNVFIPESREVAMPDDREDYYLEKYESRARAAEAENVKQFICSKRARLLRNSRVGFCSVRREIPRLDTITNRRFEWIRDFSLNDQDVVSGWELPVLERAFDVRAVVTLAASTRLFDSEDLLTLRDKLPVLTINGYRLKKTVQIFRARERLDPQSFRVGFKDNGGDADDRNDPIEFLLRSALNRTRDPTDAPNISFSKLLHELRSTGDRGYFFDLASKVGAHLEIFNVATNNGSWFRNRDSTPESVVRDFKLSVFHYGSYWYVFDYLGTTPFECLLGEKFLT
ncbi:hypothetical protein QAD02_001436 [Eretmocerus hayati]|uniref:Uncharacterized protein n=1 Tax=Eretmocerus hayati TaxID=131215 RepID=A0ACC2NGF9_9HYME|nr:hypothetical protein QAD02_001436 [Eretmocerus hayati]